MATRQKTVEYVFQTDVATLALATRRDLPVITVYLPENSITFRSVEVQLTVADDLAAAGSVTNWLIGIKLGAVAFNDVTVSDTITNSGEAQAYCFNRDVTSYFTTNWAGTSMTCQVGLQIGGVATQNHCAKLIITYDYDDTTTTHVKTIRVPIESTRDLLTTTMQTVGGATAIPAIGGSFMPEASKVVRQVWVELWGNERTGSAGDFIAQMRVNGGTSVSWWDSESALQSARWGYGIVDITAEDLSVARSLECAVLTTTNRMGEVGGMVCVTYEFNASTTTSVFNSLIVGAYDSVGQVGGVTSAENDVWGRDIFIEEPGTITLQPSGVCIFGMDSQNLNIVVGVGGQTMQTYSVGETTGVMAGQWSLVHRIDAAGQAGSAGMTLARGRNSYVFRIRTGTANRGWNVSGFLVLNYTSDKHTDGVGVHSQSRYLSIANTAADDIVRYTSAVAPAIPEANYWLVSTVVYMPVNMDNSTGQFQGISAERTTGEGEEDGWEVLYGGSSVPDNENSNQTIWGAARKAWRRYPADPDASRMDIETARRYKIDLSFTGWAGLGLWYTYHAMTWAIAGTISGSAGGTVTIDAFRKETNEHLARTSRSGNGAFSIPWYDNTEDVYVVAYEDATHAGRSDDDAAA